MYYTYAWLREDRTPYYIGKGHGRRAFDRSRDFCPPRDRILILKRNLTEEEAFKHETYMIAILGRKDTGTGILRNKTDGGEGASGLICSNETKEKLRKANLGKKLNQMHRKRIGLGQLGRKRSHETIKKMKDHYLNLSQEEKEKLSQQKKEAHANRSFEEKQRIAKKISETLLNRDPEEVARIASLARAYRSGRSASEEERKKMSEAQYARPLVECPHCGKIGKGSAMSRWHFDRCKNFTNLD